ncbi:MAG: hypothetical protein GC129_03735 [Proteobacteria bacterium]|nr:hypothetical protein [Pseudomonadota bacterium]
MHNRLAGAPVKVIRGLSRAWRNGRRIGLKRLSAPGETRGVELPKFGETFTGNPEPSPVRGRCRD